MAKFIFFKKTGCAPCEKYFKSSDWCRLTTDINLRKYFTFECREFDDGPSNNIGALEGEKYKFILTQYSPYFIIEYEDEGEEKILKIGSFKKTRKYEAVKRNLLNVIEKFNIKKIH